MRILGLDFGAARIGVAVSDATGTISVGLANIERSSCERDMNAICCIVREKKIERIVLGLPLNMNGTVGEQARRVLLFKDELERATGLPVETVDERLTTAEAERVMLSDDLSRKKRRQRIDRAAAQLILQQYLERRRMIS